MENFIKSYKNAKATNFLDIVKKFSHFSKSNFEKV